MGKRELLIAAGFLVAGVVAYFLTAEPAERPVLRHSLPAMVDEWRQNAAQSAARETVQTIGTRTLDRQVSEVRVSGFTRVHVIGEDRQDATWTLSAEASGPSAEAAREAARKTTVAEDRLGDSLLLSPKSPENSRQTSELTVRLPAGMAVRVESSRRVTVERAGRVRLEGLVGDVTLTSITGAITGSHRNGTLEITDAANVTLNLNGSKTTATGVSGELVLTARNGDIRLVRSTGSTSVDCNNVTLTIDEPAGPVRANVGTGALVITRPRGEVQADVRNARGDLSLDRAVPVTLVGQSATLAVALADALPISVDATITDGKIDASAIGLSPERVGNGAHLEHAFGTAARVTLRGTRGEIVITRRK
jgi:hypothetical protein